MFTLKVPAIWMLCTFLVSTSLLSGPVYAVNFAAGAKPEPGYSFKMYPFYYFVDTRTDKDGHAKVTDLGMKKYGVVIGNSYQIGNLQLSALIPFAKLEVAKLKASDNGIGDIQLRAGWFLPLEWITVQPALMVKVPSGSFNKQHAVNLGDGQTDLATELYLYKLMQPFSFDAVLKYNVRFHNTDSDVTPGNEFSAEGLVTVRLAKKIRIGPAINFVIGEDNKRGGIKVPDSGMMRLAAGGEIYYGRFKHLKLSLAVYKYLVTRNANQGVLVINRIAFVF